MKIGLLTTSFPRYEHDVAGNFVLGFARALRGCGHDVDVLAPEPREPRKPLREAGVTVHQVPYLRPRTLERTFYGAGVPDNLARDPLAWLGLAPYCVSLSYQAHAHARRAAWQVVVSHWALPCALAACAVRGARPHLAVLHSADIHVLRQLPGRAQLAATIARGADALWFVSEAQRQRFCELLPPRQAQPPTVVCPMGIELPPRAVFDDDTRAAFRRRHQLHGYCVLLLGRLVPIKGIDVALRAAALGGGITLLVAGEGPMRSEWTRQAAQLNVAVRWLGSVHGEEKHRWLHAADAFALPSRPLPSGRSEGLPCALLEALASGLPAVASDMPGIRTLAAKHAPNLHLVRPNDPVSLHHALLRLRNATSVDKERRADVARAIRERFGWSRVGAQVDALLRTMLSQGHPVKSPARSAGS